MTNSPALLSDETIDELGYARFTATSDTSLLASQSTALSAMVVTGPTKSPPPVLMPRPRLAIHPTLKLTNAFANHEPSLSPTPSPSAIPQDEYPDQPPSTYLTPPLAPILKPVATPTPRGLSGLASTTQQQQTKEEISPQQQPFCGTASPTTPASPPTQPVISALSIGDDSNLNHHQISSRTDMATQQQFSQSEEQEAGRNQHPSTPATDDARPHGDVLARKPGAIALTASTSAPLVPSPLVKSTLASQLSSSSSASSSGSEQQRQQQNKQQSEKVVEQQNQPQQEQKEQQYRQQRRLRKSLSTEQLPKSDRSDFQHSDSSANHQHYQPSQQQQVPLPGGNRPPAVEKLIYSGGGKSTLQQLQQEYLLRQNGYLRRQVDALKFDNMESQRQHQELATRMKQLEIQLLEEKKRQTPQQTRIHEPPMTTNEYQHHHYYHHNVFAPPPPLIDNYHISDDEDEEGDVNQRADDGKERGGDNDPTTKKRPGNQTFETVDDKLLDQHRRQRPHEGYGKSMDEDLPEDKHYMERRHGFSPSSNIAATKKPQQQQQLTNQQKRPLLDQRRHSSHIAPIPSTSDSVISATQQQQQRPRQRHVTAPSLPHHYRDRGGHGQQDQRGWNRQRSRSVPKNEHLHSSPHSHYRQQQSDRTHRGKPIYFDDNDSLPCHHYPKGMFPPPPPPPPPPPQQEHEEMMGMGMESDEDLDMAPGTGFENEDEYYYGEDDDEEDYLEERDYYRYHMTAPGPPMIYYPPPPPEAFFNDPYATMPPMGPPPPLPPLPLHRRKSASALRPSRAGPQGFMNVMNPDHYERPLRPPMRRNWNAPQANQLRQMHMTPPSPRQQQQHQHEPRGYRVDPVSYGSRQRGHPPPPLSTTMSIAPPPPRSGAAADHHLPRKASAMASPRMTTLPLRKPMVTRGSSIGSYPGRV